MVTPNQGNYCLHLDQNGFSAKSAGLSPVAIPRIWFSGLEEIGSGHDSCGKKQFCPGLYQSLWHPVLDQGDEHEGATPQTKVLDGNQGIVCDETASPVIAAWSEQRQSEPSTEYLLIRELQHPKAVFGLLSEGSKGFAALLLAGSLRVKRGPGTGSLRDLPKNGPLWLFYLFRKPMD
jgi:hypothetical protein